MISWPAEECEGHGPWIQLMIDPEKYNENFQDSFIMYFVSILHFSGTQNEDALVRLCWVSPSILLIRSNAHMQWKFLNGFQW
jgi:hypothetical protein